MEKEFTDQYYKCENCKHIWDYDDDACPECGEQFAFNDINLDNHISKLEKEMQELVEMKNRHQ